MSEIRDYLEEKLALGEGEWLRREPRTTHPAIIAAVRAAHAAGGSYNDEVEQYVERVAGDLPEHRYHGHEDRHRLTCQLGHEVYLAKQVIRVDEHRAKLAAYRVDGFARVDEVKPPPGRYERRSGTLYNGYEVHQYGAPVAGRIIETPDGLAFLPGRNRTNGYRLDPADLVRVAS